MMHLLVSIIGILITIFFVIGTHESAHFFVARLVGVKVLRFSIGFGKTLFRWYDKQGTEYVIALLPLGGYVKMLDETEDSVPEHEKHLAYNQQPFYKKFLIVVAGPLTNIFCALILYWLIFMIGFTTFKPLIGTVQPDSIAAQAGLKSGEEIIALDGHPITAWTGIILRLLSHVGNADSASIEVINPDKKIQKRVLDLSHWQMDGLTPDPLSSIGITPYMPTIPLTIGKVAEDSPAFTAGFKQGDKIIAINQQVIRNWSDMVTFIMVHPDEKMTFTVERSNKLVQLPVITGHHTNLFFQKTGYLGLGPEYTIPKDMLRSIQYGPLDAFSYAARELYDFTYFNILLIGKLLTGKLSLQSLGGPITIFETAGDALNIGFVSFLGFLAFLSISIGIINFLPLPGLDGGHLLIQFIECVIQRPIPEKIMSVMYRMSFMLIIFVLMIALVNDVLRL
jgi:regulator of sigma E protease